MSSWSFHLTGSSRAHLRDELLHRLGAERAVSLLGVVDMTAFGLHCETEGAREPEALHQGVPSLSADLCIRDALHCLTAPSFGLLLLREDVHCRWPLGRGFERYYGFLGGDTHQYYSDLVEDNHQVDPPATPEEGYHLTEDLTDRAIAFVRDARQVAPSKPFFLYFATGCAHAPHHAPREWVDRYRGRFDMGWERARETIFARQKQLGIMPDDAALSPRDPDVPDWDSLSDDELRACTKACRTARRDPAVDHRAGTTPCPTDRGRCLPRSRCFP
jgi:hypothetical protein